MFINIRIYWFRLLLILSMVCTSLYAQATPLIEPPVFSHESGFYPESFDLRLQHSDPNAVIYYTLDGSVPDPENLSGSTYQYKNEYAQPLNEPSGELLEAVYQTRLYSSSILIKDRTAEPNRLANISTTVDKKPSYFPEKLSDTWENKVFSQINRIPKEINRSLRKVNELVNIGFIPSLKIQKEDTLVYKGTPVRALVIASGGESSEVITQTYFIGKRDDFSLPVISITAPEKDLFDYRSGAFVAGIDYDKWLTEGVDIPIRDRDANWSRRGENIKSHLLFLNEVNQAVIKKNVDIRVNGGASRAYRNKSIRLYPRKKYNERGIDYPVFEDDKSLEYSRIILRNAGNHFYLTYFADAAIQRAMSDLNFGVQRYQPMVVFINGEYNGILNARDRHDKYYLSEYFELPSNQVDLLDNNKEVKEGDTKHWEKTLWFIENTPKDSSRFFSGLESLIDIESFIDYQGAEVFLANTDWPHNNIRYWRYKGTEEYPITATGFTDGRWRWLLFDVDHTGAGVDNYDVKHNSISYATEVGNELDWSTFMLRSLLENPEFKQRFITRFSDLLNSTFQSERIAAIIRDVEAGIEAEMPRHIERWSSPRSMGYWRKSVDSLVNFFDERPTYQWQHLQEFFTLQERYTVAVSLAEKDSGAIKLNTLTLDGLAEALPWRGKYFQQLPLILEALPATGYEFSHWEAAGLSDEQAKSPNLQLEPDKDIEIRAVMLKSD